MRRTMRAWVWLVVAAVVVPMAAARAWAQPMAELTPDDAMMYLGWRGAEDMGADYEGSHLQGVMEVTGLMDALPELLAAAESFATEQAQDEQAVEVIAALSTIGSSLWTHGGAMYMLPAEDDFQGPPIPRVAFLFRRGGADEPALRAALADLVRMANEAEEVPVFMGVQGDALFLSVGFDAAELPEGDRLPADTGFQRAMGQVQGGAALTAYFNGERLIAQIDRVVQMMRDDAEEWGDDPGPFVEMWPTLREVTGLSGVRQLALTAGIVDRRWETRMYLDAPAPRVGILSLIDTEPIRPEQLLHVPKTATYVQAGSLDPSRILDVARDILGAVDPGLVDELDNALEDASEEVGFDLEGQLIDGLGPTWTAYIDPMTAGNGLASMVLVNELRDPGRVETALMRLCDKANNMMEEEMDEEGIRIRFLTRRIAGESVVSLGVPFVSPSYMVHDGKLYMAFFPQALEMALDQSGEADDSILANEAFQEAMARVGQGRPGQPPATALSFTDLPESAPDGYGMILMIAQVLGGASEMTTGEPAGFQLPPVGKLMPFIEPAVGVAWVDDTGLHARWSEPFPGSSLLGPGKGMESSSIIAAPVAVGIMLPALGAARDNARRMQAMTQARGIHQSMIVYANGNRDTLPDDIALLVEGNFVTPESLVAPHSERAQPIPPGFDGWDQARQHRFYREYSSFVLVPLGEMDFDMEKIAVFQRPDDARGWERGVIVCYADGHAQWEHDLDWLAERLEEQTGMTMDELIERQVAFEPED